MTAGRSFRCLWCDELVAPGDLTHALLPSFHFACALRASIGSIGHIQKKCSCYVKEGPTEDDPPGLTKRQAARLVANYISQQRSPSAGMN